MYNIIIMNFFTLPCTVHTAGVGNTVASTDLVCDLIAKVIPLCIAARDATQLMRWTNVLDY